MSKRVKFERKFMITINGISSTAFKGEATSMDRYVATAIRASIKAIKMFYEGKFMHLTISVEEKGEPIPEIYE